MEGLGGQQGLHTVCIDRATVGCAPASSRTVLLPVPSSPTLSALENGFSRVTAV